MPFAGGTLFRGRLRSSPNNPYTTLGVLGGHPSEYLAPFAVLQFLQLCSFAIFAQGPVERIDHNIFNMRPQKRFKNSFESWDRALFSPVAVSATDKSTSDNYDPIE